MRQPCQILEVGVLFCGIKMVAGSESVPMKLEIPSTGQGRSSFKLWEYRVSHKQLLLRRPKLSDSSKNFDLMFYNVEYMDLPSVLPDLELDDPNQEDIAFAESRVGKDVEKSRVFVLKSEGLRHIVVAGAFAFAESSMGVFESPFTLHPVESERSMPSL